MTTFLYFAVIFFTVIYTLSYAAFEWKRKNKFCAISVIFVCLIEITLPIIRQFFA